MTYRYTVSAAFDHEAVAVEWLEWLRAGHCQEVLDGGALQVEVLRLDSMPCHFEARYVFQDRAAFIAYENSVAPVLRQDGLQRFPESRGICYARSTGSTVFQLG